MGTSHVHYYKGLVQLPKDKATQFGADSVLALAQPHLGSGGAIATNASTAVSSTAAPAQTQIAVLKPPAAVRIYFEVVNESNTGTVATTDSPIAEGETVVQFGEGWTISILELT